MIAILDYGMGNLFSIYNGLKRVCNSAVLVSGVSGSGLGLREAEGVVVPGVGAFDDGIRKLKPFVEALLEVVDSGVPVLGICIGMQVLFEESEERREERREEKSEEGKEGGEAGLGLIPGRVVRLPASVRVPHIGWNNLHLRPESRSELLDGISDADYFYFVHSYYCVPRDEETVVATVEYGVQLAAVVKKENIYGVQFHPEKSSKKGLRVLSNFVKMCTLG